MKKPLIDAVFLFCVSHHGLTTFFTPATVFPIIFTAAKVQVVRKAMRTCQEITISFKRPKSSHLTIGARAKISFGPIIHLSLDFIILIEAGSLIFFKALRAFLPGLKTTRMRMIEMRMAIICSMGFYLSFMLLLVNVQIC